jgi:hypothetical protein
MQIMSNTTKSTLRVLLTNLRTTDCTDAIGSVSNGKTYYVLDGNYYATELIKDAILKRR